MLQPLAFWETIVGALTQLLWRPWWHQAAIVLTALTSIMHPFSLLLLSFISPWVQFSGVSKMNLPMFFSQAVLGGTSHSAGCLTLKILRRISCLLIFLKVSPEASDMLQCIFYACCSVLLRCPIAITRGFLHLSSVLNPISCISSSFCLAYAILLGLLLWSTSSSRFLRKALQEVKVSRACITENVFILLLGLINSLLGSTILGWKFL